MSSDPPSSPNPFEAPVDDAAPVVVPLAEAPVPPLWRTVLSWKMLVCLATGFASGLPLWVLYQLVPAWLAAEGVDYKTIGLFALVGVPYTWKFVWAPLLDRYVPPFLGRRRGWALITQVVLIATLAAFGLFTPDGGIEAIAGLAVVVAFFGASQDIALDAWRRELLRDEELGLGNAMFVNAYKFASLVPGGLSLILADSLPWSAVHGITAAFMGVGLLASLLAPEPDAGSPPRSLVEAVVEPFREFFQRGGLRGAGAILAFLVLYKLGDSMATAQITPFYLSVGFSLAEVGSVAKLVGLWASIAGAFLGGMLMTRLGVNRALWVFGVAQMVPILGFAALNETGPVLWALGLAVGAEYLGIGLGTAAFVAFMQRETNARFTATQYALLSSIVALPRTFVNATSGWFIEGLGWTWYFVFCTALALPGMLMLTVVAPWGRRPT